jgi:hypothetical protein
METLRWLHFHKPQWQECCRQAKQQQKDGGGVPGDGHDQSPVTDPRPKPLVVVCRMLFNYLVHVSLRSTIALYIWMVLAECVDFATSGVSNVFSYLA